MQAPTDFTVNFHENTLKLAYHHPPLVGEQKEAYHYGLCFQEKFSKKLQIGYSQPKLSKSALHYCAIGTYSLSVNNLLSAY